MKRIRKANLPAPPEDDRRTDEKPERIGFKDILAMIIAFFSVVLPYVLIFVAVMALLLALFYFFLGNH